MIFGSFRSFQNFEPKILKKIQFTLAGYHGQLRHFLKGFVIFHMWWGVENYETVQKVTQLAMITG